LHKTFVSLAEQQTQIILKRLIMHHEACKRFQLKENQSICCEGKGKQAHIPGVIRKHTTQHHSAVPGMVVYFKSLKVVFFFLFVNRKDVHVTLFGLFFQEDAAAAPN